MIIGQSALNSKAPKQAAAAQICGAGDAARQGRFACSYLYIDASFWSLVPVFLAR